MAIIQPISTTRVTDTMTRGRLTAQIQNDQLELFRLQNQLSTGLRYFLPSDDPASAQRAMALQRTIERKEQSLSNINGAVASLTTTLDSIRSVNNDLNTLKADALGVIDTIANEDDRTAVIASIDQLIEDLARVGNSTFATNYLLGGAERSSPAFGETGLYVEYLGDESSPQTFVDIGQLFDTGLAGTEVFGGVSDAVRGSADLNPQLTPDTRLSQINGGVGLSPDGSIEVTFVPTSPSDPTTTSVIDLSQAKTIDDVAKLIESNAPAGSEVFVTVEDNALRVDVSGGLITVGEVGSGDTARELGILSPTTPAATVNGTDLDPTIRPGTRLEDLDGARARGRVESAGFDNDIVLTATANGAEYNGVTVEYVAGATAGSEVATFTPGAPGTLSVQIADGVSTAEQVAAAINNASPPVPFTAELDYRDQTSLANRGTGTVSIGASLSTGAAALAGGVDGGLDLASGLQLTNGADYTIDTSSVETVEQLLSLLNNPEYGLAASINASGDGIDVRTRRSGADFAIGENGGDTAAHLGIRTYTESSRLEDFNRGLGVVIVGQGDTQAAIDADTRAQNTLLIEGSDDGTPFSHNIDPVGLTTVDDLINRINATAGGDITASLATSGNGIVLTRTNPADPAAQATVDVPLAGDTLSFTADDPGAAGNALDITVRITDSGGGPGPLDVQLDPGDPTGQTVLVELNGADADTDVIAAQIDAILPNHSVTSQGPVGTLNAGDPSLTPPTGLVVNADLAGGFDADEFTVSGNVAERLGFLAEGETEATSTGASLVSTDRNPEEVDSVFTALIRMREALEASDTEALERELETFDDHIDRVSFARAEVGVRLQNLESIEQRLSDEEVTLRTALSEEIDADLVEVISDYTAKQYAMQASLQTAGSILNLSILDYI